MLRRSLPLMLLLLPVVAVCAPSTPTCLGPNKKLIEWGWDEPGPAFMRQHAREMDLVGFDGLVFHADAVRNGKPMNFSWNCWSSIPFAYEDFRQSVADLRACHFHRLTDNFLRFNVCPGDVDWFNDKAFAVVANNARVGARVARDSGCKGFMFDVEMYNKPLFTYAKQIHKDTKSFAEYSAMVRRRGREFMTAIDSEYPDITILLTYGYGITGAGGDRSKARYGLLKDFLDGMFEAAAPGTVIVDAYEGAYSFRKCAQFVAAYRAVRQGMLKFTAVPQAYRRHIQVGFGIWMDMNHRRYGWHTHDFERNYFTPEEFTYSLFCGLHTTDRYVWVYTEIPKWWTDERVPYAYQSALRRARRPRVIDDAAVAMRHIKGDPGYKPPHAADQPGYSDEATFGDLKDKYVFLTDLPTTWKFCLDPKNVGVKQRWFAPQFKVAAWRDLQIGKFWDEQGIQYVGAAWYRLQWHTPHFTVAPGQQVVLWFGAADETATVWVNGVLVGHHDEGPDLGWDKRFPVVVTGKLLPGQDNTIAVRVGNSALAGGLWKSIRLALSK